MALALVTGIAVSAGNGASAAVLPALPPSTQFDITGFLQVVTLDQACVTAAGANLDAQGHPQVAHCGGTMMLNGHTIIVPNETIAILPASALTWQELFAQAPAPYGPTQTGMALADLPKPLTTYEVQAVGNRVLDPGNVDPTKRDRYIAGLVHISQQDLNAGAGYINFMDYTTGEMRVGGVLGDPTTGARVQINDPANPTSASGGRYGRALTPDPRFMVDQDNPTIASATGYPMCFPRTDPAVADDPLCPVGNRPLDVTGVFSMAFQKLALLKWYQDPARAATFPAGGNSPFGLAFDGSSVWVASNQSDTVSKVNPATGLAVNVTLPAGSGPFDVAFDGTNIWATDNLSGKVSKIVASTGAVVGSGFNTSLVSPVAGSGPVGIAFDGTSIWVANSAAGTVSKINPATGAIEAEFQTSVGIPGVLPEDASPTGVAFDGSNIWVTNNLTGTVSKIDRSNNTFVEFETNNGQQPQPWGVAFDGTNIWVANDVTNSVVKMNPLTGGILSSFPTGGTLPQEVVFDGSHIWVSNNASRNVSKIDPAADIVIGTIDTGLNPQGIVFDGTNIWVANSGGPSLSRLLP